MYNVVLYVHVLALVYWLGGDLGTFLSSRHVLRSELGVESRQTAFNILMECDMGPRLAMPLILGSGFHLSSLRWPGLLPDGNRTHRLASGDGLGGPWSPPFTVRSVSVFLP